jgi:hypothetical protein
MSDPRSGRSRRPSTASRLPTGISNHCPSSGPLTTSRTGARTSQAPPRPSMRTIAALMTAAPGLTPVPAIRWGSSRISRSAETAARWVASSATGPCRIRYKSTLPEPATTAVTRATASRRAERRRAATARPTVTLAPAAAMPASPPQVPNHAAPHAATASGAIRRSVKRVGKTGALAGCRLLR